MHRLPPLDYPPNDPALTAGDALRFPAVQLFVEHAAACGSRFALTDEEAPVVGEICRRLDGIALAIELAAGRVEAYGVRVIAVLLDSQLTLCWDGRRTAVPRHRTLSATFDWSHNLLSATERVVLRRLAVFSGYFSLAAALSIAAGFDIDGAQVANAVASLVAKSLLLRMAVLDRCDIGCSVRRGPTCCRNLSKAARSRRSQSGACSAKAKSPGGSARIHRIPRSRHWLLPEDRSLLSKQCSCPVKRNATDENTI